MSVADKPKNDATRELRQHLQDLPPGQVTGDLGIDRLLAACWDELDGSSEGGMEAWKLINRMECVDWESPALSFLIKRHGAIACGGNRSERQHWSVDLDRMTAHITQIGYEQEYPMAARVSVKQMAAEIAERILNGDDDDGLQWLDDGSVKVRTSRIFPKDSGYKRTVEGRRKRLCDYISDVLVEHGWRKLGWNWFGK